MLHFIRFLILFWLITVPFFLLAQTTQHPWSFGISAGKTVYTGDLGNGYFDFNREFNGLGSIKIARCISPSLNVGLNLNYGKYGFWINEGEQNFSSRLFHVNIVGEYKFNNDYILPEDVRVAPYLFAGIGVSSYSPINDLAVKGTDFTIPVGLGAKIKLTDNFHAFWQGTIGFTLGDDVDFVKADRYDRFMSNQIGITYSLGNAQDSDNDGISDLKDECINTFGLKSFKGCPDTDGDGIKDIDDYCPKKVGLKSFNGCPDTDDDGIPDQEDRCPNAPGEPKNGGCPDTDEDGIIDSIDSCPNSAGKTKNGCPILENHHASILMAAQKGIRFKEKTAEFELNVNRLLDRVASLLKENTSFNLRLLGHTARDHEKGMDKINLELSQARTDIIKSYLLQKGISENRITAIGYGDSRPIASNSYPEGRRQNERVEFLIEN